MRAPVALALIGTTLIASSPAQALDVCSLISQSEISAAMGQPISSANLGGPDVNHDAAYTSWTCTYILPENVLVVSVDEFASAGEARKHITLENLRKGIKGGESIVSEEKGVGDRTFLIVDREVEVLRLDCAERGAVLWCHGRHGYAPHRSPESLTPEDRHHAVTETVGRRPSIPYQPRIVCTHITKVDHAPIAS